MERNNKRISFAVIGRPNVGKSTLFNYLIDQRKSVVKNQPGVTRDILFEDAELWGKSFQIIDTGGLTEAEDQISKNIRTNVIEFLKTVDYLLVVMDYRAGLCPEDREIIRIAKESGKEFLLIINKVDKHTDLDLAGGEFYEFGMNLVPCALESRSNMEPLLEWIHEKIEVVEEVEYKAMTFSIVGKPNVGKSSLCNTLLGERRMLVTDIAGTTVDPVDSAFERDGKHYVMIDTAGLRRSAKRDEGIEIISAYKTESSIRRSEMVLLMIDGMEGPTEQDAKILQSITEAHKGVILVVNKLDLGEAEIPAFRSSIREKIKDVFHFYQDIPICFISAKSSKGIKSLFELIDDIYEKLHFRISTSELNDFFMDTIRKAPSPVWGVKNVKFYYLTQTKQVPPSFIAFANHPDGVDPSYRRFLSKHIRKKWGLEGIPIRIFVMKSKGR